MLFPDEVPTLSDGVVTLRAHRPADVPRIVEQCRDPGSLAWTGVPAPYGEADAREFVGTAVPAGWAAGSTYYFAIELEDRFAGTIDLRMRTGGEAEIGFGLHPDARGGGAMRRALNLILDWGFRQGVEVVQWRAFPGNWASRRTVWGAGFSFGPTIPGLLPQRGERRDGWTGWIGRNDPRAPVEEWFEPPVLEAEGLRLRPWQESDGEGLVEAALDPWLQAWVPQSPLPRAFEEVADYLLRVRLGAATGGRVAWCVADADSDAVLGNVALFAFEDGGDDRTAELGYWSHPAGRGRGVMTTALRTATRWAMGTRADGGLGVRRLYLLTPHSNQASRRLAERVGFRLVGTERAAGPATGPAGEGFEDSARYDLVREDLRG